MYECLLGGAEPRDTNISCAIIGCMILVLLRCQVDSAEGLWV